MTDFTVVGITKDETINPITPFVTDTIYTGDIIFVEGDADIQPNWFRVYDSGNKGLRLFCVTGKFIAALMEYQAQEVEATAARLRGHWAFRRYVDDAIEEEAAFIHSHPGNGY